MRQRLESIVKEIKKEMRTTGCITINGKKYRKNSLSDNPYAGLCKPSITKLMSLAPDLKIQPLSFMICNQYRTKQAIHWIAKVETPEGVYHVDPTIQQYLFGAEEIYGPGEKYPIKILVNDKKEFE